MSVLGETLTALVIALVCLPRGVATVCATPPCNNNHNNAQAGFDDSQTLSHSDRALNDCPPCQADNSLKTSQSQGGKEINQLHNGRDISSDHLDMNQVNSSLNQVNSSLNQVNSSLNQVNSSLNQVNSSLSGANNLNDGSHFDTNGQPVPGQGTDVDQVNQSRAGMNQSHPCCTHDSSRQEQSREAAHKHGLDIPYDNKRPPFHYVYLSLVFIFFIAPPLIMLCATLDKPKIHISSMAKKMMSWARRSFRQNDQPTYEPV